MLPRIKVNSLQGISYKNITIKLKSGVYKYNLASQTDLGLPENAFVYGIMIRKVDKFSKSINNRPLIEDNILNSTYLTLLDIVPKAILKEYPLKQAIFDDMIIYFEPKKRNEIDWSRSSINIFNATNQAALTSDMDFEFIVLYYDPSIDCKITPLLNFRSGICQDGMRTTSFEIIQETGIQKYPISEQSSLGIDENDIILGFMPFSLSGIKDGTAQASFNSAFLTMSRQTRVFIDKLPIIVDQPNWFFNTPYIPIQPTLAKDIDWQTSQIEFTDIADVTGGNSFVWNLIYYRTK